MFAITINHIRIVYCRRQCAICVSILCYLRLYNFFFFRLKKYKRSRKNRLKENGKTEGEERKKNPEKHGSLLILSIKCENIQRVGLQIEIH